jgi:acyl-CoA thioesterase-1
MKKFLFKSLSFILIGFLTLSVFANDKKSKKILIIGDSISAGYGLRNGLGWVDLMSLRLKNQNTQIINASISGETTAGGRQRVNPLIQQITPDVLIIELGANDGLRGFPIEMTKGNLDHMIKSAKTKQIKVLLLGMKIPSNYGAEYTNQLQKMYANLATEHQIALVPFLLEGIALRRELFQEDGLHPNETAQPMILDRVIPKLKPLLQ